MKYDQKIILKDGRECILRSGTHQDAQAILDIFILTHEQTDFLLSYPDEISFTAEEEGKYLQNKTDSENEVEILAFVDGVIAGTAGVDSIGNKYKIRHRCDFGISVDKAYWGLGIGRALTKACIDCAKKAGYQQMELQVVADNEPAVALYLSEGFVEYGRNPFGFCSRITGPQEVLLMRLKLK